MLPDNANVFWLFTIHNDSISNDRFLKDMYIFVWLFRKENTADKLNGLFYCEISDHLPNCISIKLNNTVCEDERPMTSLFDGLMGAQRLTKMEAENWNDENIWCIYWRWSHKMYNCSATHIPTVRSYCPRITETLVGPGWPKRWK